MSFDSHPLPLIAYRSFNELTLFFSLPSQFFSLVTFTYYFLLISPLFFVVDGRLYRVFMSGNVDNILLFVQTEGVWKTLYPFVRVSEPCRSPARSHASHARRSAVSSPPGSPVPPEASWPSAVRFSPCSAFRLCFGLKSFFFALKFSNSLLYRLWPSIKFIHCALALIAADHFYSFHFYTFQVLRKNIRSCFLFT